MLSMLGFKSTETGRVSEEELRLIVTGAKQSGGIESQEGMMIEGVLDLQVFVHECSSNSRSLIRSIAVFLFVFFCIIHYYFFFFRLDV